RRRRKRPAHVRGVPRAPEPLPTGDLKKLFREAAKRMHPDLAPDDATRVHADAFMKRLNQAFAAADADAIADLVRQWDSSRHAPEEGARQVGALQAEGRRPQARCA